MRNARSFRHRLSGLPLRKCATFVGDQGLRMDAPLTAPHQGDKNEQDYSFYNRCFSSR